MGRDFFGVLFLLGKTSPDFSYLNEPRLIELCDKTDLKKLSEDIRPFVFESADSKKIISFKEYMENS